jgi:hypothetical protein
LLEKLVQSSTGARINGITIEMHYSRQAELSETRCPE